MYQFLSLQNNNPIENIFASGQVFPSTVAPFMFVVFWGYVLVSAYFVITERSSNFTHSLADWLNLGNASGYSRKELVAYLKKSNYSQLQIEEALNYLKVHNHKISRKGLNLYVKNHKKFLELLFGLILFLILLNFLVPFLIGPFYLLHEVVVTNYESKSKVVTLLIVAKNVALGPRIQAQHLSGSFNCDGLHCECYGSDTIPARMTGNFEECTINVENRNQIFFKRRVCNDGLIFGKICTKTSKLILLK